MSLGRLRVCVLTAVWRVGGWLAERRRPGADSRVAARLQWREQTRRMGLSVGEALRDRWRPRWLRLVRTDPTETTPTRGPADQ